MKDTEIENKRKEILSMSQEVYRLMREGKRAEAQELFMKVKKEETKLSQMILDSKPWNKKG